jgi:hypothetical protein
MADALYHGSELGVSTDEGVDNYGHRVTSLDEVTVFPATIDIAPGVHIPGFNEPKTEPSGN